MVDAVFDPNCVAFPVWGPCLWPQLLGKYVAGENEDEEQLKAWDVDAFFAYVYITFRV